MFTQERVDKLSDLFATARENIFDAIDEIEHSVPSAEEFERACPKDISQESWRSLRQNLLDLRTDIQRFSRLFGCRVVIDR